MSGGAMNADRLLKVYEQISEAPDAIARLRRFVLDLAVRGKLVEQDAGDEPASSLIEEIARERTASRTDKKRKAKEKSAPVPFAGDLYDLPIGWAWSPLIDLSDVTMGQSPPGSTYNKSGDGVPLINGPVEFTDGPFGATVVNQYTTEPTNFCEAGDFLICVRGSTTGRTNVAAFRACIGRGVAAVRSTFDDGFIRLFLWKSREDIIGMGRGIAFPSVSKKQLEQLAIPLPPLAEQHRIVAKVDELMALCDRLEQARKTREEVRDKLTAASLARLTAPATISDDFPTHAAFALEALPALTTRPDQIKTLRQTILNLAVRGKLVEQDPADEPASELLKAIAVEQEELAKAGKIKRPKPLPPVDTTLAPFDLPLGWSWARFPELGIFGRGKSKHRPRNDLALYRNGTVPFIQTGDVARSGGRITSNTGFYNEVGLAQSMLWPRGTMCITIAANIADSGILEFDACFPDSVVGLVPASMFDSARYFEYFIRTAKANLLEFAPATAQKNINLGILETVLIPLPPLAEQHRIVAKVDALMALCDRLEAALTTTDTTRTRLLEALLHEALDPVAQRDNAA